VRAGTTQLYNRKKYMMFKYYKTLEKKAKVKNKNKEETLR